jgi:hypothetical protein
LIDVTASRSATREHVTLQPHNPNGISHQSVIGPQNRGQLKDLIVRITRAGGRREITVARALQRRDRDDSDIAKMTRLVAAPSTHRLTRPLAEDVVAARLRRERDHTTSGRLRRRLADAPVGQAATVPGVRSASASPLHPWKGSSGALTARIHAAGRSR